MRPNLPGDEHHIDPVLDHLAFNKLVLANKEDVRRFIIVDPLAIVNVEVVMVIDMTTCVND